MINGGEYEKEYSESDALLSINQDDEVLNIAAEKGDTLGTKSLNTFYSIVFIINQIYGPGVLAIPIVFQQGGWLLTSIVLGLFLILSCFSSTLLCEALSLIPGNRHFDKHIEFTVAVKHYFGHRWYMLFQLLMNLCMQSYNIASIIICARSLDQFMMYIAHKTYALELIPNPHWIVCTQAQDPNLVALYGSSSICISLGYILVTVFCLPAGFLNLADNVKAVQLGSFVVLTILMGEFCVQFATMGVQWSQVPAVGDTFTQVVSIFIFSWAYVMFVPSWVNEKRNDVSVNKVIWTCGVASFLGYLSIGILAALTVPPKQASDDLLSNLGKSPFPVITIIASYIFSLGVIAPGIPVCCITTRYNLYIGKVCGRRMSYFWGVIAPWLVAYCFAQGAFFANFINWSSLVVNGIVNFMFPLALYYKAVSKKPLALHGFKEDPARSAEYVYSPEIPSVVNPWPGWMRKNAKMWTIVLFCMTVFLVLFQVILDLYYLIVKHDNLVGGN